MDTNSGGLRGTLENSRPGDPVNRPAAGDAPELARLGPFPIGTATQDLPIPGRSLCLRTWYPAVFEAGAGAPATYDHKLSLPGHLPVELRTTGVAIPHAPPIDDALFPVVVMSHGFGGWNTQFSRLAEHIASCGHVVVSIDHRDQPAATMAEFLVSFGNVLVNRSHDQRAVLARLRAMAAAGDARLPACADMSRLGLIGYSMGGYGALITAGATPTCSGAPFDQLPEQARAMLREAAPTPDISALVLFAPWGGQPQSRAWDADSLAQVRAPTLVVSGSEDDIVDHADGVRWIFENLAGSDRRLLTYREARHNIVGDPFDLGEGVPFAAREFLCEPVWRTERLNAINQHFVTAFLELHLKGRVDLAPYLDVPIEIAGAGQWPVAPGEMPGGAWATAAQPGYWKGFQRRWATGLELVRRQPY